MKLLQYKSSQSAKWLNVKALVKSLTEIKKFKTLKNIK